MEERNYKVYMHTLPNGKKYVGITRQDVKDRWQNGNGYKSNSRFYRAILKYGWENIKHEILFNGLTQEEAYQLEIAMIALNESNNPNYGYNQTEGGENKWFMVAENKPMPSFEEICNSEFLLGMFESLIDSCFYHTVTEETTTITFNENGEMVTEVVETQRTVEPDLIAINIILDNYGNEERLKAIIEELKANKSKLDD